MTRFNITLLTLLLPAVLAAPSRRSTIVPCKRNSTRGPYDGGNGTDVYGPTGTGTGFPLSTGVPISILSSSLADASPDPSAAPVDSGSDDDCPATTTITSTNIVTETVIPATDPAQTQASGSSAAGSAALTSPAGPYGNSTDSSSQYGPGPTGTAGSTGRSSRHGHKHTHKTTKSPTSTGTSIAEVPVSISTSAVPSSSSSDADSSSSEVATSEASDVASAVQVTSTTASSTVDPATSSDQSLTPTTTSSTIAVAAPTSTRSSTSESPPTRESSSTGESYSASASSSISASSITVVGGEFYQGPKTASSTTITPSSASPSSTSSSPSSSSEPSSSGLASLAQSSTPPTSSLQSSTMTVPSSASTTASSTTSTRVSATVGATPNTGYSSSPGTGKRGLAYNAVALTTCFDKSSEVSWAYNWGSSTSGLSSVFEYVPMLWGTQSEHTNNWQSAASAAIASGSKHLLSFNEPDLGSQSNLSPAAAVAGHKTYLQPFAGRAKISAPAVTNGGLAWLEQFLVACSSCTIDFVPVHWYDSASNIAYFKSYITSAIAAAKGRPIWITEFGASGTQAQQVAFLQEVMPWLDGQAAVERYAYFGVFDGKLVSGTSMSALGQTFATYT